MKRISLQNSFEHARQTPFELLMNGGSYNNFNANRRISVEQVMTRMQIVKGSRVRFVEIETPIDSQTGKGTSLPVMSPEMLIGTAERDLSAAPVAETVPYNEELYLARQIYQDTKLVVKQALRDARTGKAINVDAVSEVVHRMTDSLLRHPQALTSLSHLKDTGVYILFHSVNTAILALALGQKLKMDPVSWRWLGIGTLLHDIGTMKITPDIVNKPGRITHDDYEVMKQHTLRGTEILSSAGFPEKVLCPALEHHERIDGSGYPFQRKKHELTLGGLISSLVDIYDAITSDRIYRKAVPSHEALRYLYSMGLSGHVDSTLVQHFIQCIGVYPVGSCVLLNTGEIAIVRSVHLEQALKPLVILVRNTEAQPIKPSRSVDLMHQTESQARKITAVLDPTQVGISTSLYLDRPCRRVIDLPNCCSQGLGYDKQRSSV